MTSNLDNMNRNPTGKGGFQERPEDINRSGTWNPKMTFGFQYRRFLNMPVKDFRKWQRETPENERTVVEEIAYTAVFKAKNVFRERQEIANRTEGMPKQSFDATSNGQTLIGLIQINEVSEEPIKK